VLSPSGFELPPPFTALKSFPKYGLSLITLSKYSSSFFIFSLSMIFKKSSAFSSETPLEIAAFLVAEIHSCSFVFSS
jgi:hypothetical protein